MNQLHEKIEINVLNKIPYRHQIRTKFLFGPGVILSFMAIAIALSLIYFNRLSEDLINQFDRSREKSIAVSNILSDVIYLQSENYRMMSLAAMGIEHPQLRSLAGEIMEGLNSIETKLLTVKADTTMSNNELEMISRTMVNLSDYGSAVNNALNAVSAGTPIAALFMIGVEQNFNNLKNSLEDLGRTFAKVNFNEAIGKTENIKNSILAILVIAVILIIGVSLVISMWISTPINRITAAMTNLALGKTDVVISGIERHDEIGAMARTLSVFKDNAFQLRASNEQLIQEIVIRKNTEKDLILAKEQSELASRTKSEFLANMSHELRTPLNAIIGFSEMIEQEILGPIDNDRYKEYADNINTSGKLLLDLISDVLDVSKIETGNLRLEESPTKIIPMLEKCIVMMSNRASIAGIKLSLKAYDGMPEILVDQTRVQQIILNLMTNSIKFTNKGGQVVVLVDEEPNGSISLTVSDTGIGMSKIDLETALTKFGQVENSMTKRREGAGLGLTIVTALVELHSAELTINSKLDVGTETKIVFPVERTIKT